VRTSRSSGKPAVTFCRIWECLLVPRFAISWRNHEQIDIRIRRRFATRMGAEEDDALGLKFTRDRVREGFDTRTWDH
jgi:hypothetical protein